VCKGKQVPSDVLGFVNWKIKDLINAKRVASVHPLFVFGLVGGQVRVHAC